MISKTGHRSFEFVDKKYIAQGSLTQLFTILQRTQGTTDINNTNITEIFTPVTTVGTAGQIMGRLEIMKPSQRFAGISIGGEVITHCAYTNWDRTVFELDIGSLFCDVEYPYGNRRFKLLSIEDYSEMQKFIKYYLKETGYSALPAAGI